VAVSGIKGDVTELESIPKVVAAADRPYVPIVFFAFGIKVMLFAPIFRGIAFERRRSNRDLDSSCRLLLVVRGSDANCCRYRCAYARKHP
jgi:hypothetical protein